MAGKRKPALWDGVDPEIQRWAEHVFDTLDEEGPPIADMRARVKRVADALAEASDRELIDEINRRGSESTYVRSQVRRAVSSWPKDNGKKAIDERHAILIFGATRFLIQRFSDERRAKAFKLSKEDAFEYAGEMYGVSPSTVKAIYYKLSKTGEFSK